MELAFFMILIYPAVNPDIGIKGFIRYKKIMSFLDLGYLFSLNNINMNFYWLFSFLLHFTLYFCLYAFCRNFKLCFLSFGHSPKTKFT